MLHWTPKLVVAIAMFAGALAFAIPGFRWVLPGKNPDSFPVSSFGMFSRPRPKVHKMPYLRVTGDNGRTMIARAGHALPGGMNATLKHLNRAIRWKDKELQKAFCRKMAKRLASRKRYRRAVKLSLMQVGYKPKKIFRDENRRPEFEREVVSCEIPHKTRKDAASARAPTRKKLKSARERLEELKPISRPPEALPPGKR